MLVSTHHGLFMSYIFFNIYLAHAIFCLLTQTLYLGQSEVVCDEAFHEMI